MTGTLRSTAKNPVAAALMGLLIVAFLILGVGGGKFPDAFGSTRADSVVTAGGHAVSTSEFKEIFDQQRRKLEEQNKITLTPELLAQNNVDQQILSELAMDRGFSDMLNRAGVVPGRSLIDDQIKKIMPAAFDRVTGKFSEQQFTQLLQSKHLTPVQAETQIADEMAQRHFGTALESGLKIPRIYAAISGVSALENRDVSYFILDLHTVPQPAAPNDAQLTAFMQEHSAQLKRTEMRTVTMVKFSAAALAPTVAVDPAAIQKEFDFRKDALSSPEKRTLVEIPLRAPAEAALAAARLARGEDPAAVAKAFGVDPISYVDTPLSAIADRKVAGAAFAMVAGEAKGPVQGDLGIAALKVIKITPGSATTLAAARPKIEADLRLKAARDKAYQQSQAFDDSRQAGSSVVQAAQKMAAQTVTIGPFDDKGVGPDRKPNPLVTDKMVKAAFAQAANEDSELQDAGQGEYFALHVDKVIPPALPALADIREPLVQAYMSQTFMTAVRAKVDALVARVKKGETLDQVAASLGDHVVHQAGLQRLKAQQFQALGKEFLDGVFGAKPGDVFGAGAPGGVYVAKLDAIRPGDATTTAKVLEAIRSRASQAYVRDVFMTTETAARDQVKVTLNLPLARQSIGVDPNIGKPGAKTPPKAP